MSANAGPSRKRRRLKDGDTGDVSPHSESLSCVKKDMDVWLSDGNIVVIAEDVAFRVHRSTLALRSEVFRDLFSLPASAAAVEAFEKCPVVHVSDSHEDIRRLFLVICCGRKYVLFLNSHFTVSHQRLPP